MPCSPRFSAFDIFDQLGIFFSCGARRQGHGLLQMVDCQLTIHVLGIGDRFVRSHQMQHLLIRWSKGGILFTLRAIQAEHILDEELSWYQKSFPK